MLPGGLPTPRTTTGGCRGCDGIGVERNKAALVKPCH